MSKEVSRKYLEYKNKMSKLSNDTVLSRWGMYTNDKRYKDYTASIVNMIMKDMNINTDQAYYMLYYMVSNDINDYERAKLDMYVDENFEIYRTKRKYKDERVVVMKPRKIIKKDVSETIRKLLHGLDYNRIYIVEFLHDKSVEVKEVEIVRDKKTNKVVYYKEKG